MDGVTEHVFVPWLLAISQGATRAIQGHPGPSRAIQRLRQAETPRMSSYLLGFAIGDFSVIHLEGKSPVPMALYAQRGKAGLGNDMLVEWWL